jgi:Restriction endonuclease
MANRIGKFERCLTINVDDACGDNPDDPAVWAATFSAPTWSTDNWGTDGDPRYIVDDDRVEAEIHRLTVHKTCPLCRNSMYEFPPDFQPNSVILLCQRCGYWGGRGTREWGLGPFNRRGVIGRYDTLTSIDDEMFEALVMHFVREKDAMLQMSPQRAEKFAVDLISDALDCETVQLGGVKDGGVDGYIVTGDHIKTIIQVKWRESTKGSESVGVVREVAGTLVARGVAEGILVSTRESFSAAAEAEAKIISSREISGIGKLSLTLVDYNNILDMLEISHIKLTDDLAPGDWLPFDRTDCIFDGRFYRERW